MGGRCTNIIPNPVGTAVNATGPQASPGSIANSAIECPQHAMDIHRSDGTPPRRQVNRATARVPRWFATPRWNVTCRRSRPRSALREHEGAPATRPCWSSRRIRATELWPEDPWIPMDSLKISSIDWLWLYAVLLGSNFDSPFVWVGISATVGRTWC